MEDTKTKRILVERGHEYGDYTRMAEVAQQLKAIMQRYYTKLHPHQRESLDMTATKIARILVGNPHNEDSWRDIAGYTTLCANQCSNYPREGE